MDGNISIKCPGCNDGELDIVNDEMKIPHFGNVHISTLICPNCGYRSSDIVPIESGEPSR